MGRKKVFISHCENNFDPTAYAIHIIELVGCIPVVAEREPKLSRDVKTVVYDLMNKCDAVIVIATPDRIGPTGMEPSPGVLMELGHLQENERFKNKYVIIKEESVVLGAMSSEARYKFTMSDCAPIAEAILIELGSMRLFRNYYELPGSDSNIHELMEIFYQLREMGIKKELSPENFERVIEELIRNTVKKLMNGVI